MIKHPEFNDIKQMKNIWKLCFGDSDEVVDCFFSTCFDCNDCFISSNDKTVEAMIFMISSCLKINGKSYNNRYMYGVSTLPDFQGRGIMSSLITAALFEEKERGTQTVCCIPASESLFQFYSRFGFQNGIYEKTFSLSDKEILEKSEKCEYIFNENIGGLTETRNRLLNESDCVLFPEKYLALSNGFDYSFVYSNNFYAFFTVENKTVRVADCAFSDGGFNNLCFALQNETTGKKFDFSSAPDSDNKKLKGVIRALDNNINLNSDVYLGIKME